MRLDVPTASSNGPLVSTLLCDPRLHELDISYWTNVQISNNYAAVAIPG